MTIQANFPAIKPSLLLDFANVKELDPRITFTRASTAAYYDGKTTVKAEENLLTYSQEFDDASWGKNAGAMTVNSAAAPDGTSTAETFTASASTGIHGLSKSLTTTQSTVSVFVKAGTHAFFQISSSASGNNFANFNLTTGAVGTFGANATASIVNAGNGWYRCVVSVSTTAVVSVFFNLVTSASAAYNESWAAAGTETLFVWGAQLEQRSTVTAYTPTTTQAITNYIPQLLTAAAGVARFDHNPITGESLGLLIEEQRTNLLTYSEQFDNAAWAKSEVVITANAAASPAGTITAAKFVPSVNAVTHYIQNTIAPTTAQFTGSVYVKLDGSSINKVTLWFGGAATFANFDLSTVTASWEANIVTASITMVGNGWYRLTTTCLASVAVDRLRIYASSGSIGASATAGNGTSGIYIWGAQLEAGAFATSYIPTVAAQVTRSADAASMTGTNFSSWFNASEGTLYANATFVAPAIAGSAGVAAIGNGSSAESIAIYKSNSLSLSGDVRAAAATQASFAQSFTATACKGAIAYRINSFNFSTNAAIGTDDTNGVVPTVTSLFIGSVYSTTSFPTNGTIKNITYYPRRLSNTELQAITG